MRFSINRTELSDLRKKLEEVDNDFELYKLNRDVENCNHEIFQKAVEAVAKAPSPLELLLKPVEVEQIRKVSETNKSIQLRSRGAMVTWSDIAYFVRNNNKQDTESLPVVFRKQDYTLFNAYGANLIKSPLPRIYANEIKLLAKYDERIECFLYDSNRALEKQLNILFDIISEKSRKPVGVVRALKSNSKLIRMEYMKYSSLINNISIVYIDRLIDLVLRQYAYVDNQKFVTATSMMDIHKEQIPDFYKGKQALLNRNSSKQLESYQIIQKSATSNVYFNSMLYSDNRKTRLGLDIDYSIEDIEKLLLEQSAKTSRRIWNTLIEYGEHGRNKFFICKHISGGVSMVESYCDVAMYAPNGSVEIRKCPSTLIYMLRNHAWLPNKQGEFFKPADILINELDDDFIFNNNNLLMVALKIGLNRICDEQNQLQFW